MPTKPNYGGGQQPYVPQGNGDPSGEYADQEGGNVNFKAFKLPSQPATPQASPLPTPTPKAPEPKPSSPFAYSEEGFIFKKNGKFYFTHYRGTIEPGLPVFTKQEYEEEKKKRNEFKPSKADEKFKSDSGLKCPVSVAGINPQDAEEMAQVIRQIGTDFPKGTDYITYFGDMSNGARYLNASYSLRSGTMGAYDPIRKAVMIRRYKVDDYISKAGKDVTPYNVNVTRKGVTAHEMGHAIFYQTFAPNESSAFSLFRTQPTKNKEAYDALWKIFASAKSSDVSVYAKTNENEFVAECFCSHYTDGNNPTAEKVFDLISKAYKGGEK